MKTAQTKWLLEVANDCMFISPPEYRSDRLDNSTYIRAHDGIPPKYKLRREWDNEASVGTMKLIPKMKIVRIKIRISLFCVIHLLLKQIANQFLGNSNYRSSRFIYLSSARHRHEKSISCQLVPKFLFIFNLFYLPIHIRDALSSSHNFSPYWFFLHPVCLLTI